MRVLLAWLMAPVLWVCGAIAHSFWVVVEPIILKQPATRRLGLALTWLIVTYIVAIGMGVSTVFLYYGTFGLFPVWTGFLWTGCNWGHRGVTWVAKSVNHLERAPKDRDVLVLMTHPTDKEVGVGAHAVMQDMLGGESYIVLGKSNYDFYFRWPLQFAGVTVLVTQKGGKEALDRLKRQLGRLIAWYQSQGQSRVAVLAYPDGHRRGKLSDWDASQKWMRSHGLSALADLLLYTCNPRTPAAREILQAFAGLDRVPVVYLVSFVPTKAIDKEGLKGFIDNTFTTTSVRVPDERVLIWLEGDGEAIMQADLDTFWIRHNAELHAAFQND